MYTNIKKSYERLLNSKERHYKQGLTDAVSEARDGKSFWSAINHFRAKLTKRNHVKIEQ